jgi:hypothetical protein
MQVQLLNVSVQTDPVPRAAGGALLVHSALVARTDWLVHLSSCQLLDTPLNSQWIHMFEDIQSNAVLTFTHLT